MNSKLSQNFFTGLFDSIRKLYPSMAASKPICIKAPYVVAGKYELVLQIGAGSFGKVFLATNQKKDMFAVKVSRANQRKSNLTKELQVYKHLRKGPGFPQMHFFGTEKQNSFLVMDLMGMSLQDLHLRCSKRFSLKTVLLIAEQAIDRLEFIHARFFLHCDVKPANFLIGNGKSNAIIHLVDFGLSERFLDTDFRHFPNITKNRSGTPVFASLNIHNRETPSRRDDLESLGYMIIYLYKGSLPWQFVRSAKAWEGVGKMKMETSLDVLCEGCPEEFISYLEYCRELEYDVRPNYTHLRKMFRTVAERHAIEYDYQFDWVQKGEIPQVQVD